MDESKPSPRIDKRIEVSPYPRFEIVIFGALLAVAALVYQGFQGWIALRLDDTNHLETPLALATARQLADGPSTLYGPFSGTHPEVLIHAPLYYRLAGITAWPFVRLGVDPLLSSLFAGRALSLVGLLAIFWGAWKIAEMDADARGGGAHAVLLIGSSPVMGSFGFTVRPDTLGIGLQTLAFGMTLRAVQRGTSGSAWRLIACGVLFGLTACVKQHLIVAGGVAVVILLAAAFKKTLPIRRVLLGLGAGLIVIASYYGAEEWVTHRWMSRSVYELPSRLRELAPASWGHVRTVFMEVAKRGLGALILALTALGLGGRRTFMGTPLDLALLVVFGAETLAMVPLCLASEGAYVNYAMPSVVWGSILLGRALARILTKRLPVVRRGIFLVAAVLLLLRSGQLVLIAQTARQDDLAVLADLLEDPIVASYPPKARYFVGKPQHNRLYGALDLAHDEWLYQSYEQAEMAEPRSGWLKDRIAGPGAEVRLVIVPSREDGVGGYVPGVPVALPDLGYRQIQQYGEYAVWLRER